MSFLNEFKICARIPNNLLNNIQYYHVFINETKSGPKESLLFVTNNDKVYAMGYNYCFKLGLPKNNSTIKSPKEVKQLSDKGTKEFFVGSSYVLALTSEGRLYSWGYNDKSHYKPRVMTFFDDFDFKIKQIRLDYSYIIILLENNVVFTWGEIFDKYDIDVTGRLFKDYYKTNRWPEEMTMLNPYNVKVNYIDCNESRFFAILTDKRVVSWGHNNEPYLGHEDSVTRINSPRVVKKLADYKITDLKCSDIGVYFLSEEGNVYVCGDFKEYGYLAPKYPTLMESDQKFIQLERIDDNTIVCINEKQIVYELRRKRLIETEFISFEEYSIGKRGINYKTFASGLRPQIMTAEKVVTKGMENLSFTSDEDEFTCKICFERKVQLTVIPCGHTFCDSCAAQLTDGCYICRRPVSTVVKLRL